MPLYMLAIDAKLTFIGILYTYVSAISLIVADTVA